MRKIAFILTILVLFAGCAVNRKKVRTKYVSEMKSEVNFKYDDIVNQNLTGGSFFIERAEFNIRSDEGEKSGLGTIKFLFPDKFLISIKSNAGIEVARIFITGDSIMVNDRLNKKLFQGSASYLRNKYGLTTSLLPVLLGDYVNDEKIDSGKIRCKDGKVEIDGIVESSKVMYIMDCESGKSILTVPKDGKDESTLEINYSEFFMADDKNAPGKIEIIEKQSNTIIEIRIQRIVIPWNGTIEFIPGKQYEKIRLL